MEHANKYIKKNVMVRNEWSYTAAAPICRGLHLLWISYIHKKCMKCVSAPVFQVFKQVLSENYWKLSTLLYCLSLHIGRIS